MSFAPGSLLIALILALPGQAHAREVLTQSQIDGHSILFFDDGFWRYADENGPLCTPVAFVGEVCALPSQWAPFPSPLDDQTRPTFIQDTTYIAQITSLTQISEGDPITLNDVRAYILNQTTRNGVRPSVHMAETDLVEGVEWQTIPVLPAGPGGMMVFSFTFQKERAVIAFTKRPGTTLYHADHRQTHQGFLKAIRLEVRE